MQQDRRDLETAPAAEEEQNNNEDKVCLHSVRTLCMTACNIYHNSIYYMVPLYSDLSIHLQIRKGPKESSCSTVRCTSCALHCSIKLTKCCVMHTCDKLVT